MLAWTESTTPRKDGSSARSERGAEWTGGAEPTESARAHARSALPRAAERTGRAVESSPRALEGDGRVIGGLIRDGRDRRAGRASRSAIQIKLVLNVFVIVLRSRIRNDRVGRALTSRERVLRPGVPAFGTASLGFRRHGRC